MKLLVLPFGDAACASTHYRVIQYLDLMKADGIECDISAPGTMPETAVIAAYDAVLVQKKLFPISQVRKLRACSKRLLFDIDDATWHPHGRKHSWWTRWRTNRRLKSIAQAADVCLVANGYIARHLSTLGANAQVVPMSLKSEDWPVPATNTASRIRIGWAGAPSNLRYLEALEPMLAQMLREHPSVELAVFCGKEPDFSKTTPYVYMPWHQGGESEAVRSFHIGLLPLPLDDFSQGKSPIKALQYMAAGIPLIATPAAGALEIGDTNCGIHFASTHDQWLQQLGSLITNALYRNAQGEAARKAFVDSYTATQVYAKWRKWVSQS